MLDLKEVGEIELDDVNIGILAFLSDVPNSTTTEISRALFKPPYNIRKLDCFIRYRVNQFVETGIIKQVKKGGKNRYSIDENKVFFGQGVLKLNGADKMHIGYFVVIKTEDATIAKSIDDYERRIGRSKKFL